MAKKKPPSKPPGSKPKADTRKPKPKPDRPNPDPNLKKSNLIDFKKARDKLPSNHGLTKQKVADANPNKKGQGRRPWKNKLNSPEDGYSDFPTVQERVNIIETMLSTGSFARGTTIRQLATKWGISVSAVALNAAEAQRNVENEEFHEQARAVRQRYLSLLERTTQQALLGPEPDYKLVERNIRLAAEMQGLLNRDNRVKMEAIVKNICRGVVELFGVEGSDKLAAWMMNNDLFLDKDIG